MLRGAGMDSHRPFARGEALHARANAGINEVSLRNAVCVRPGGDEREHGVDAPEDLRQLVSVLVVHLGPGHTGYGCILGCGVLRMLVNTLS